MVFIECISLHTFKYIGGKGTFTFDHKNTSKAKMSDSVRIYKFTNAEPKVSTSLKRYFLSTVKWKIK